MTRKTIEEHLAPAPTAIRRLLLEDRHDLEPGAAAVVGRLFASVHKHRASISMPPAQCFREAAQSDPHFGHSCVRFRTMRRMFARRKRSRSATNGMRVAAPRPRQPGHRSGRKASNGLTGGENI